LNDSHFSSDDFAGNQNHYGFTNFCQQALNKTELNQPAPTAMVMVMLIAASGADQVQKYEGGA